MLTPPLANSLHVLKMSSVVNELISSLHVQQVNSCSSSGCDNAVVYRLIQIYYACSVIALWHFIVGFLFYLFFKILAVCVVLTVNRVCP